MADESMRGGEIIKEQFLLTERLESSLPTGGGTRLCQGYGEAGELPRVLPPGVFVPWLVSHFQGPVTWIYAVSDRVYIAR